MTAAAWVQAIGTCALIVVTGWYVLHTWRIAQQTKDAATAARDSANAATQLVRLEQEKLALARDQEKRDRERDRSLLAGALAAELRAFLALWEEIEPCGKPAEDMVITWGVQQSYTTVLDTAGPRLFLLGRELVVKTVTAYAKLKRGLDNIRFSSRLTEYAETFGRQAGVIHQRPMGKAVVSASEKAVATARRAVEVVKALLPELDAVAEGKQPEYLGPPSQVAHEGSQDGPN